MIFDDSWYIWITSFSHLLQGYTWSVRWLSLPGATLPWKRKLGGDWQGLIRLFRGTSSGPCYHWSYVCKSTQCIVCHMCDMCTTQFHRMGPCCSEDFYYALPKGNSSAAVEDIVIFLLCDATFFESFLALEICQNVFISGFRLLLLILQTMSTSKFLGCSQSLFSLFSLFSLLSLFGLTRSSVSNQGGIFQSLLSVLHWTTPTAFVGRCASWIELNDQPVGT